MKKKCMTLPKPAVYYNSPEFLKYIFNTLPLESKQKIVFVPLFTCATTICMNICKHNMYKHKIRIELHIIRGSMSKTLEQLGHNL